MFVQSGLLVQSLIDYKSIIPAIDDALLGQGRVYRSVCPVSWNVFVSPTVISRLLDGRALGAKAAVKTGGANQGSSGHLGTDALSSASKPISNPKIGGSHNQLHVGVLGIACKLYKPRTYEQLTVIDILAGNGISQDKLGEAMRVCRGLGMLRSMRSHPEIGLRRKLSSRVPKN